MAPTCMRLEVQEGLDKSSKKTLFVKSVWDPTSFSLAISDGLRAWTFDGSEAFVKERAEVWDKPVSWVMEKIKFYLTVEQPGVTYSFIKIRDNHRKLSFEIQDKETDLSLTANFSVHNASDPENVTSDLLGFLVDGNNQLTENYLKKCRSFDRMMLESENLLEQNKRFVNEKNQFEQDIYKKFVAVLNTKKSKLKELKKEVGRWAEQSKAKESDERDDTTSSSSEEDEEEADHRRASRSPPVKRIERGEASSERLVSGDARKQEPVATSAAATVVDADPEATRPVVAEVGNDVPLPKPPKEAGPSNAVAALLGDTSYTGLPRKRRRN